jgi:hypothetical protein
MPWRMLSRRLGPPLGFLMSMRLCTGSWQESRLILHFWQLCQRMRGRSTISELIMSLWDQSSMIFRWKMRTTKIHQARRVGSHSPQRLRNLILKSLSKINQRKNQMNLPRKLT